MPENERSRLQALQLSMRLDLVSVELSAEGVEGLAFIEDASLSARVGGREQALSWNRQDQVGTTIALQPASPVDMSPLLDGAPVNVDTHLRGTLPTHAWTLRTRACFQGTAQGAWTPFEPQP